MGSPQISFGVSSGQIITSAAGLFYAGLLNQIIDDVRIDKWLSTTAQ